MISALFMEEVTNIKSSIRYGDVSVYGSYADFKSDRRKWSKWYEEHKCNLELAEMEETLSQIRLNNNWIAD